MSRPSAPGLSIEAAPEDDQAGEGELDELRHLLLWREQSQLSQLQERLEHLDLPAESVGRVLPEAVATRTQQDHELSEALLPSIQQALSVSVRRDPHTLADALFPVMGPAIRKAVATALREMMDSFNRILEQSVSWQSVKWRWEALRTGKTLAEVALMHNLLYRVEQVFLIHKPTGLLLNQVAGDAVMLKDADLVSGMLTAIQDFVHDSFRSGKDDQLETLQVGELAVWIEQGPRAVLAGVIRGNAPLEVRTAFRVALEKIHLEQGESLGSFDGDVTPFEQSRPHLESCLQVQYESRERTTSPVVWILVSLLVLVLGTWAFTSIRDNRRWSDYLGRLRAEPGIVVTENEKRAGGFYVSGLRDPLATDPALILRECKIDVDKVNSRWEPYFALEPPFLVTRAQELLKPPQSVRLEVVDGVLTASGEAPSQWIQESQKIGRFLPGIRDFRTDQLVTTEWRIMEERKREIESASIRFVGGTTAMAAGQTGSMDQLVAGIRQLLQVATVSGREVTLEVIGHTDGDGTQDSNLRLSRQRAEEFTRIMKARGITSPRVTTVGKGSQDPARPERTEQDKAANRRVTFRVTIMDVGQ